jgi:hypothetical protein
MGKILSLSFNLIFFVGKFTESQYFNLDFNDEYFLLLGTFALDYVTHQQVIGHTT